MKYIYWKEIAPSVSISAFKNFMDNVSQEIKIILAVILIAILGGFYVKRKQINEKVQTFVESNSALE